MPFLLIMLHDGLGNPGCNRGLGKLNCLFPTISLVKLASSWCSTTQLSASLSRKPNATRRDRPSSAIRVIISSSFSPPSIAFNHRLHRFAGSQAGGVDQQLAGRCIDLIGRVKLLPVEGIGSGDAQFMPGWRMAGPMSP